MSKAPLFLVEPIVKESRDVIVPAYDHYFEKEENVPGVMQIFETPVPRAGKREFHFARTTHQEKHETIDVRSYYGKRIDQNTLLKIANSLGIDKVKIREYSSGSFHVPFEEEDQHYFSYRIGYGPKSSIWDNDSETLQTIESDLVHEPVLCYGITTYESNQILHSRPTELNKFQNSEKAKA